MHAHPGRHDRGSARGPGLRALRPLRECLQRADRACAKASRRTALRTPRSVACSKPQPRPPVEPALGSGVAMDARAGAGAGTARNPSPTFELESLSPSLSRIRASSPSPQPFELPAETEAPAADDQSLEFDAIADRRFGNIHRGADVGRTRLGQLRSCRAGRRTAVEPETIEAVLEDPVSAKTSLPRRRIPPAVGEWSLLDDDAARRTAPR